MQNFSSVDSDFVKQVRQAKIYFLDLLDNADKYNLYKLDEFVELYEKNQKIIGKDEEEESLSKAMMITLYNIYLVINHMKRTVHPVQKSFLRNSNSLERPYLKLVR